MSEVHFSAAVSIPTLVASILSFTASSTTLILHLLYPPKWHFRHALIINLFIADTINSLNNSVSGIAAFINHSKGLPSLSDGPACQANAYIGQFSVQAIDFNTLIIALVVLFIIRQSESLHNPSRTKVALLCAAAWFPSLITANVGLGLHIYGPVSGNWCWIKADKLGLRYALTHGWRIAIFLATTGIYIYIYIYLKMTFKNLRLLHTPANGIAGSEFQSHLDTEADDTAEIFSSHPTLVSSTRKGSNMSSSDMEGVELGATSFAKEGGSVVPSTQPSSTATSGLQPLEPIIAKKPSKSAAAAAAAAKADNPAYQRQLNLRRMLLLNGYPIFYVILWIPGMANRLAESVGHTYTWLSALQATTQLIGFANALTYGYNEQMKERIRQGKCRLPFKLPRLRFWKGRDSSQLA